MQLIEIQPIPNQSFNVQLENTLYKITLKTGGNFMFANLIRNGEPIVLGMRLVPGEFMIPYSYLAEGNFIIVTRNGEYPDYTQFGISQYLLYFSAEEWRGL